MLRSALIKLTKNDQKCATARSFEINGEKRDCNEARREREKERDLLQSQFWKLRSFAYLPASQGSRISQPCLVDRFGGREPVKQGANEPSSRMENCLSRVGGGDSGGRGIGKPRVENRGREGKWARFIYLYGRCCGVSTALDNFIYAREREGRGRMWNFYSIRRTWGGDRWWCFCAEFFGGRRRVSRDFREKVLERINEF